MIDREQGQALPLALLNLAFGTLVIASFLGHASSNMIGSRVYGEAIIQQSSGDAGIEHAIWRLTNDGLAEVLSSPGDEVTYELGEMINGLIPSITVTANATGGDGGTTGNITDTVIDTLDFAANGAEPAKIIPVTSHIYAIVYTDGQNDGWVKTVEVAADGMITDAIIDSLEFDTKKGRWADIIYVSGDVYAIVYQGNKNDGFLKTVAIAADGDIADSVIDSLEFDTKKCVYPEIVNVAGDIYAIAYQGNKDDGFLKTVAIAADGDIADSVIDSLEFDTGNGREPDIVRVSGDIYAIAYRGNNRDGFLKTIEIAGDGTIISTVVDTFEFNTLECNFPVITNVSGDIYAIAYDGDSASHGIWGAGILTTVAIASDGMITDSIVDETVFDSYAGEYPDIIHVSGSVYAIAYTGRNGDGWLKTVTISPDGSIDDTIIDSLEFDDRVGYYPDIIHIAGDVFAIAYTGTNQWHGMLKSVAIATTTTEATTAAYGIVVTTGETTIRASVNIVDDTVSIVSWQAA